jgi:hypothetical protein
MGMEDALMALYEEPEAMHELIDYITARELEKAQIIIDKIHPDALSITMIGAARKTPLFLLPCLKNSIYLLIKKSMAFINKMGWN